MKRWILFLLFFALQIGYKTVPVLAQEDKDTLEVKKVVETFLKDSTYQDIDSAMQYVSVNYSVIEENDIIDYAKFKSGLENKIINLSKKYTAQSTTGDLEILKLDIQDNKAAVEIKFTWKGFNLDTIQQESSIQKRHVSLARENGSWKITQWRPLEQPK